MSNPLYPFFAFERTRSIACALIISFATSSLISPAAFAQDAAPRTSETRSTRQSGFGEAEIDQSIEMSADRLIDMLRRENGLLLQVKRALARKAYQEGRILDLKDLSDEAVFRLLQQDANIRVLATSEVLKRRYVQALPSPEDSLSRRPKTKSTSLENTGKQTNKEDEFSESDYWEDTAPSGNASPTQNTSREERLWRTSSDDEPLLPNRNTQPSQEMPRVSPDELPALLRTSRSSSPGFGTSDTGAASDTGLNPSGFGQLSGRDVSGSGLAGLAAMSGMADAASTLADNDPNWDTQRSSRNTQLSANARMPRERLPRAEAPLVDHKLVPYADVPSLYDLYGQSSKRDAKQRFAADIFARGSGNVNDLPIDLPVGPEYVVGPGDGLRVELTGAVSRRVQRIVDRQGRLSLPEVGALLVAGKTLGKVQEEVQTLLRTEFRDVNADVSLGRLRSVRVYVVGDVQRPGAYDISALSTPLNAVLTAGGPTARGSLRTVKHFRAKEMIQEVDIYDLLLRGVHDTILPLEPGDTILVPPLGPEIALEGMVRRPALYELKGEKNLMDAMNLAGGILPTGSLRNIEVERMKPHESSSMVKLDLQGRTDAEVNKVLTGFAVQEGDRVRVYSILPFRNNTVFLDGHVFRPGKYAFTPGMHLTDIVKSYQELLPEPYLQNAEIIRLAAPDYRPTIISFNLRDALAGKTEANLALQPFDTVRIYSRFDFEDPPLVDVSGEVRRPGEHRTNGVLRLSDAVYLAGGLTPDASLDSAQIYRKTAGSKLKVLSVNLAKALSGDTVENITLENRDRLIIHRTDARTSPPAVFIGGAVVTPGKYPLGEKMTLAQLVQLSGGLSRSAEREYAEVANYLNDGRGEIRRIPLSDGSAEVAYLEDGDTVSIKQRAGFEELGASVILRGEVSQPSTYGLRQGERLSTLLKRAGGFTPNAYAQGIVIERAQLRDLEEKNRRDLIRRLDNEQRTFQVSPTAQPQDQSTLRVAFVQQQATILNQLKSVPAVGRLVVKISGKISSWEGTSNDVELRAGDVITIPKQSTFIMVTGQVYNPTAITYRPGKSARWYLRQAGGATELGNSKAIFVIRADGSVIGKGSGTGFWNQDPLDTSLGRGDVVVVPEKLINMGGTTLRGLSETAQIVSSLALAVSVALRL